MTTLNVGGMTCSHCEEKISVALASNRGVEKATANASKNQVYIEFDDSLINLQQISTIIEDNGYILLSKDSNTIKGKVFLIFILLSISFLVLKYANQLSYDFVPSVRQNMGYGALFLVGLITSVHCVAMCGGITISQCQRYINTHPSKPSLLYNLGRLISYTVIGGVIGGIGSVLSFTGQMRGYITLFVSFIMLLMAIRMLKLLDLPRFKLPRLKIGNNPFVIGLANGFMPCGPLQSMQLYALGTGSVVQGALSMFYFSLGTFPLMFGLGFISSLLNHKFSKKILRYSGLLIFILALSMFSRGAALAGIILPFQNNANLVDSVQVDDYMQEVSIDLTSSSYTPIRVKEGIPLRFIINVDSKDLNGCNNPITIPSINIEHTLVPGRNEIIFTPEKTGKIAYTCWMGMITSYIEVVAD
jgi:sulfite exporter TauE/SafE/copper chaperone CopZ